MMDVRGQWPRQNKHTERTTPTSQQWPWAFFVGGGVIWLVVC